MDRSSLTALLEALRHPDAATFPAAVAQLATLEVEQISPADRVAVLAAIETTVATLQTQQTKLGAELGKLRTVNHAIKAYNR